jgi:uncharacterized protein (TIGR03067 family)
MKRLFVLGLALALVSVGSWCRADDKDKVAEEDKKFEGTWIVTALEVNGMKIGPENFENMTFTFTGKKYEQKDGDRLIEAGTQDLDPGKKPKVMDITVTGGETKGTKQLAIYEIDGDRCKICAAQHESKDRPQKFETKEGSGHMLFELKRKK